MKCVVHAVGILRVTSRTNNVPSVLHKNSRMGKMEIVNKVEVEH